MYDNHNQIILKHEVMLKEVLNLTTYKAKNDTFLKDVESRVQNKLLLFNTNIINMVKEKVDMEEFNRRIRDKVSSSEVADIEVQIQNFKEDFKNINSILEGKADDEEVSLLLNYIFMQYSFV